jgi:nucleoside-diphosphate-sugar epimerase
MSNKFKHVLVTGGTGYVGSLLVPQLLELGYRVSVYDTMFFGDDSLFRKTPNLKCIKGDIRDTDNLFEAMAGVDAVINLACISNDASFELDEKLSTTINLDAFEPMVIAAKKAGIKRFVYASSSSVYGVSESPDVTEDHPLVPLTLYNKYKGMCEPLLFKHQSKDFTCVVIRPATLCGYAPRQRLDLSVNILTNHAINAGKITVFGGSQKRPNLHVQDMCDLYKLLLTVDDAKIAGQTFNAGFQNLSIMEIAQIAKRVVQEEFPDKGDIPIVTTPTDDIRSYHVNSDKIQRVLGFKPRHNVEDAVRDLCKAFKAGKLPNSMQDTAYFNVRRLKQLKAA